MRGKVAKGIRRAVARKVSDGTVPIEFARRVYRRAKREYQLAKLSRRTR